MGIGVLQGSALVPLFFILFINDLYKCCPDGKVRLFADDTTIFFHKNNIKDIISTGKQIMTQLATWLKANKLTLNAEKSYFIIFKSSRKKIQNIPDKIEFLGQEIKRLSHSKYLDITFDENLIWNNHIIELSNKLKRLFHIS